MLGWLIHKRLDCLVEGFMTGKRELKTSKAERGGCLTLQPGNAFSALGHLLAGQPCAIAMKCKVGGGSRPQQAERLLST